MPTVHRERGFRIVIWPNDHPPPHVHVFKEAGEVILLIPSEREVPEIRGARRMQAADIAEAMQMVREHAQTIRQKWDEIHGRS